jgi:phosphodiesterase/alkaline phosphatase D-like protein
MSESDTPRDSSRRTFIKAGITATLAFPLTLKGCTTPGTPDVSPPIDATGEVTDTPNDVVQNSVVDPDTWDKAEETEWAPVSVEEDALRFPLGVSTGAVTATAAIFWGFTEDETPQILKIWRDHSDPGKVYLARSETVTDAEGYLKRHVEGLAPATTYHYAWFDDESNSRSSIGKVKTAFPDDWLAPMTIAATTCTHSSHMPYQSLLLTAEHDFDAFCHLGDMSYNDSATDLASYRAKWRGTLQDPGYRAVLSKAGLYFTMDDHEITDNSHFYSLDPEQKAQAYQAMIETLPIPDLPNGRLWNSYRWGRSVEIFVLDSRGERIPESKSTDDPIYLSKAQMNWLKKGLEESPCQFKVLLNSVPILGFSEIWPEYLDRWQGYEKQRQELLGFIDEKQIENVWFLTGDFHLGYVGRVETDGPARKIREIMVGPGAPRIPNLLVRAMKVDPTTKPEFMPEGQFDYLSDRYAATFLTFDPITNSVAVKFIDSETKETLYEQTLTWG